MGSLLAGLIVAVGLWTSPADAARPGDIASKWPVNDDNPVAGLPSVAERNQNPLEFAYTLQDLISRAQPAYEEGRYEEAAKYYEALAVAVPDSAVSFSHLCGAYARLGKPDIALAYCTQAMSLRGARVLDHLRLIDLVLRKPALEADDVARVEKSLAHLRAHAAAHPRPLPGESEPKPEAAADSAPDQVPHLLRQKRSRDEIIKDLLDKHMKNVLSGEEPLNMAEESMQEEEVESNFHLPTAIELSSCRLAVHRNDVTRLTECTDALRSYKLDERVLLPFLWSQALIQRDEAGAQALLARAKELGMPESAMSKMVAEQSRVLHPNRKYIPWIAGGAGTLALALLGLTLVRRKRRPGPTLPTPQDAAAQA